MAVPKRLLKKASSRNAVKRVCREAWRISASKSNTAVPEKGTLVKLQSLPVFNNIVQLKAVIRADVDKLFARAMMPIIQSDSMQTAHFVNLTKPHATESQK
jgi:hypothetical protein